jgi:hypothetical protein
MFLLLLCGAWALVNVRHLVLFAAKAFTSAQLFLSGFNSFSTVHHFTWLSLTFAKLTNHQYSTVLLKIHHALSVHYIKYTYTISVFLFQTHTFSGQLNTFTCSLADSAHILSLTSFVVKHLLLSQPHNLFPPSATPMLHIFFLGGGGVKSWPTDQLS